MKLKELLGYDLEKWSTEISERPDGLCDIKSGKHYLVVLKYKDKAITVYFSMGSAFTRPPMRYEVLGNMLRDAILEPISFNEWSESLGYSSDSISAKKIYDACLKHGEELKWLLGDRLLDAMMCDDLDE
jgi:hypothetical protein